MCLVGNELTGNTNLITHYNLEHAYNKFCGKKVKEKLSNFLPELPGGFWVETSVAWQPIVNNRGYRKDNGCGMPVSKCCFFFQILNSCSIYYNQPWRVKTPTTPAVLRWSKTCFLLIMVLDYIYIVDFCLIVQTTLWLIHQWGWNCHTRFWPVWLGVQEPHYPYSL